MNEEKTHCTIYTYHQSPFLLTSQDQAQFSYMNITNHLNLKKVKNHKNFSKLTQNDQIL